MILDTCALLWLAFDEKKLSQDVLSRIDRGEKTIVCSLSFWEIGIKVKKKKLEIPISLRDLIKRFSENDQVEIVAPDHWIISDALDLEWKHKDPVDRMIVALAKKRDEEIITADMIISRFYSKTAI